MSKYKVSWITKQLAVGHAPMSYDDLDEIKDSGIQAIVNLCGEFCDLHEIEAVSGFEVKYLPIADENIPKMEEMEEALEWLDEAIYLGKKVLVHCRHGIGRTGTFVTAYLLRKGLHPKLAEKKLKNTRALPSNYTQWQLLKKYGKKEKTLTIREPSLETKHVVDLNPFFNEYSAILNKIDDDIRDKNNICGKDNFVCCHENFYLTIIEAVFISHYMNINISLEIRKNIIEKSLKNLKITRNLQDSENHQQMDCPFLGEDKCLIEEFRPVRCRIYALNNHEETDKITEYINNLSGNLFLSLTSQFLKHGELHFSVNDIGSGRFVQKYFEYMLNHAADKSSAFSE